MNTRKRSALRRSRNDTLPPPQPQPKRRTSRQGGPGRVGSVGESRPLTQDDIPSIIQGFLQSLTATSDSAPTETTPSPSSGVGGKSVRQADVSGGTHFPRKLCPTGQDILSVLG